MSFIVVCPKCGTHHTMEEYMESMFCRECGKFLTHRDKANAKMKRKETGSKEWGLFPYDPYTQQIEFMRDIHNIVGAGGVFVAEACNGFGKTVCALASLLPLGRRIVYATRTHEQVRQVLLELENINRKAGESFSAVNLASRQHLCLNEKCRKLSAHESMEACRLLKEAGECPYKVDIKLYNYLPPVLSISRLRREGKTRRVCPYFLARKVAEHCTLIVAPYQYIFNQHVRNRVKLELTGRVLVFDEAHNADQIGQEALSSTLSERTLTSARDEMETLETLDVSSQFLDDLAEYLDRQVSSGTAIKSGSELREDVQNILETKSLSSFAERFEDIVEEIRLGKMERGDYPVCYLNGVLSFLKDVGSRTPESYVAVYRKSWQGFNLVEYRCLDPSLAVKPVVEESIGALIMSGTLSPIDLFTEILGLEGAEKRSYSAIADPENINAVVDCSVTTRYKDRTETMNLQYGEKISRTIDKIPNGVLVFFPQRRLMLENMNRWRRTGIITESAGHPFLNGKLVFVEGAEARENRRVVDEYKKATKTGKGAVLFGVFRGRNAEGSNFPYEEARGVILVGVPYADYSDPVIKEQIRYFNNQRRGMGERWYVMDAFRAANQALGRGIRHRDDWCNFILLDHRYANHQRLISKWAVANGVQEVEI